MKKYFCNSACLAFFFLSITRLHSQVCAPSVSVNGSITTVNFNTTGLCTWTVPAGATNIFMETWGGGGVGGGAEGTTASCPKKGGGGGGGGYARTTVSLAAGTVLNILVGAGGNNIITGTGGASEVYGGATSYVRATGGGPGVGVIASQSCFNVPAGGVAGVVQAGIGFSGGVGQAGSTTASGTGGGGANSGSAGGTGASGGNPGTVVAPSTGGGGSGGLGINTSISQGGQSGGSYGGGGSGAWCISNGAFYGGSGGNGHVRITYCNSIATPTFNSVSPICVGQTLSPLPTVSTNGISGSWSPALNNTATTTYTFTPAAQCATTATLTITVNASPTVTATASLATICSGGSCTLTAGGATTYSWMPGSLTGTTVSVTPTSTTTYTVTGTNGTCSGTRTVTVTVSSPVTTALSQTNVACNGGATGAASINPATGGTGPYTYNWTPGNPTGDGTTSVTGLTAGSWTCTATDAIGCMASSVFTITQPPAISTTPASQTNIACNGGATGAASINTPTGGAGGYTYNWTPGNPTGDGTTSVTGLTAGSWTCTVTDANGCNVTRTFTITQPPAIVTAALSQTNVACFGGSNGATTISVTGGAGGYTYNWTPGNPTGDGTTSVTGLTAGSWTCTVTDANGCNATRTFAITQPPAIVTAAVSQTNVSCFGGSNGTATISVSGGAGGYTYNWTPGNPTGDGTTSVTGLTAGSWTCAVTDANACVASQTFNVTQPTALVVTATMSNSVICVGSTVTLSSSSLGGTGASTFNWTPGNLSGTTVIVSPSATTTYSVTGTDVNGCSNTASVTVNVNALPVVTATAASGTICEGATETLTANGASTYAWSSGGTTATEIVSPTTTTSYTVTGTDINGCSNSASVTVNVNALPVVTATAASGTICDGATETLTANGASTYAWSSGGTAATEIVSPTTTTSYTVTGADINGCSNSASVTVNVNALPVVTATAASGTICDGATETLTANGTSTYAWSSGGTAATEIVSPTTTTSYTVTGTDINGCSNSASVTVNVNALPVVTASIPTTLYCLSDGPANLTGAPTSGNWSGPGVAANQFDPNTAGTGVHGVIYSYTDSNGCSAADTLVITVDICTSIATNNESSFSVFPNPAHDNINVSIASAAVKTLILRDASGRLVRSWIINGTQAQLSLQGIANGVYFLSINGEVKKVIKE